MNISQNLLQKNAFNCRELEIIDTITIKNNRLVENYFLDYKTQTKLNLFINDSKGNPIFFDESDCEWLTPTFIRNKDELYGFSLIEKSNSTKLFLTKVKTQVDFDSFEPIGRFYAKDKNHYYFGPGGKKIREDYLELFFDETYRNEWNNLHPDRNTSLETKLWNSKIAVTKEKVYWDGNLKKEIHPSLKRISQYFWADNYSLFEYDLQRLKKLDSFDRQTLIYKNFIKNGSLICLVTDVHKPAHCYFNDSNPTDKYDFKIYTPLFEELRGKISNEYWWYQMEDSLKHRI
ncbi:hypothetical protein AAGV33_13285 [Flavobacterium sp. FBOR7N2.3]|uniref:DKNYY family protein n=1 Tax=Flavobacterium magnesitis TaxID=3138077 RepID=A0ABV4TMN1_9FLAO